MHRPQRESDGRPTGESDGRPTGVAAGDARVIQLGDGSGHQLEHAAGILVAALAHAPSAWRDLDSAREEVNSFVASPHRQAWLGVEGSAVRGWIGAVRHSRYAWELHPLVVDPSYHRHGWGTRLVRALEESAAGDGVVTVWLGTDDDFGGTNLYGVDLYPDVLGRLAGLQATAGHPFTFYRRLGYSVVGVLPDADGVGRHDILMARRIIGSDGRLSPGRVANR
jgi:aminoglycoside 6'-N-acetyltransferase I